MTVAIMGLPVSHYSLLLLTTAMIANKLAEPFKSVVSPVQAESLSVHAVCLARMHPSSRYLV